MTVFSERAVKAIRKAVCCDGCGQVIAVGQPATRWTGLSDGEFTSVAFHPDCREAEIALNEHHRTGWCDEWQRLCDIDDEDWPRLLAEYPTVAARLGINVKEPIL